MLYQWLVFVHVLGVFGFLLAHGVSSWVIFRVRTERSVTALQTVLQLSSSAVIASMISLVVLLAAGIWAAFVGHWWAMRWPWVALGVLVLVWAAMSAQAGPALRRVRKLAGFTSAFQVKPVDATPELAAAQAAVRPWISATAGGVGLVVLLWLMVLKPF